MSLDRVLVTWSGTGGGTAVSVLYGMSGDALCADLKTFFTSIASRIPTAVQLGCIGSGDTIDEATGTLTGSWSGGVPWTVNGTGTGVWAAGVGASVRWRTATIHAGHRVSGRTYLVPLNAFCYGSDGTLDTPALTDLRTASTTLAGASSNNLTIWSRPKPGFPGVAAPVISATVADTVSTLRSRRT